MSHAISEMCLVTPELAADWLRLNKVNRPLRRLHVEFFVKLIESGQFMVTGESIQFEGYLNDGSAQLVNGQHRLTAVSRSTRSVQLNVVQGVDPGSQVFMDTGTKRSFGDVLSLERGVTDQHSVAAAVRLGYFVEHGTMHEVMAGGGFSPPSNADLLAWYDQHPALSDAVSAARKMRKEMGSNQPAMALARMMFDAIDPDEAEDFWCRLVTGESLTTGDPVLALRRWMINNTAKRPRPRAAIQLAVTIKAWNARRSGASLKAVRWAPHGAYAEEFPVAA